MDSSSRLIRALVAGALRNDLVALEGPFGRESGLDAVERFFGPSVSVDLLRFF
jgi:hypothetical protein